MKPERVIETRHDQVIARKRQAVRQRRRRQQLEIRDVREQVLMQRPIIGQAIDRTYPDMFVRRQFSPRVETQRIHGAKLEGTLVGPDYERRFAPVAARRVRLKILEATDGPTLWEFQLLAPD